MIFIVSDSYQILPHIYKNWTLSSTLHLYLLPVYQSPVKLVIVELQLDGEVDDDDVSRFGLGRRGLGFGCRGLGLGRRGRFVLRAAGVATRECGRRDHTAARAGEFSQGPAGRRRAVRRAGRVSLRISAGALREARRLAPV